MKILIINTYYYPNIIGGTENSIKILAENLSKMGNEVAVYCIDNDNNKIDIENINGVKVYRGSAGRYDINISMKKKHCRFKKLKNKIIELRNYSIKEDIIKVLEDFQPEVVHTNNIYGISPYVWKIVRDRQIRIVHTLRDYWLLSPNVTLEDINKMSIVKKFITNIYRLYFKYTTKKIDVVTAPSIFTLDTFKRNMYFKDSEFKHINNAIEVNVNDVSKVISKKILRESNEIKFVFIGMLNKMKGIDILLKTFSKINNQLISLTICGEGELEELVKNYVSKDNRIKYEGKLQKNELEEILKQSDVLIAPSMWDEPFGRVIIEGNQFGNPIIGSNRGGIKEIIDNIGTGRLFNSNSEKELESLIIYFSDRNNIKKYYDPIIKNIDKYSIKYQINEFEKVYKKKSNFSETL